MEGERNPQAINKEEAGAKFTEPRPHTYDPEEKGGEPPEPKTEAKNPATVDTVA